MENVIDILKSFGIEPKKAASTNGGEWHSPCPGCGGRDRFIVWPAQNGGEKAAEAGAGGTYHCRQCGKTGDAIQFFMDFGGCSFGEACAKLGIEVKRQAPLPKKLKAPAKNRANCFAPEPEPEGPSPLWSEKAGKFVEWSHKNLFKNDAKLRWLLRRGIRKDTVRRYRLGWNPGDNGRDLYRARKGWGLPDIFKDNGKPKALWLPIGLVIPMIDNNRVVRVRIRRFGKTEPRYYVVPGSSMEVMMSKPGCRTYVIIEAELDGALVDQEAGDLVGVIGLGNSSRKPGAEAVRHLKAAALILNALDYDAAGAKAFSWWRKVFQQSDRWPVPAGKDPGEAFAAGVNIREWVVAGLPKGWTLGPSILDRKKEGEAACKTPAETRVPAAVTELAELLEGTPVSIQNTETRLRVLSPRTWSRENWQASKRISDLVFFNDDVRSYICCHPETIIRAENMILGKTDEK